MKQTTEQRETDGIKGHKHQPPPPEHVLCRPGQHILTKSKAGQTNAGELFDGPVASILFSRPSICRWIEKNKERNGTKPPKKKRVYIPTCKKLEKHARKTRKRRFRHQERPGTSQANQAQPPSNGGPEQLIRGQTNNDKRRIRKSKNKNWRLVHAGILPSDDIFRLFRNPCDPCSLDLQLVYS